MTDTRTYWLLGGTAAVLALMAAGSQKREDAEKDGEQGGEGEADEPIAQAGFNPGRYLSRVPEMGRLYETQRGDIMLGTCDKSIAYRVLKDAAELAAIEDAHAFACDSARRVAYASLILAAPANEPYLTDQLRRNDFRNPQGKGVDLRRRPLLWMPILDLDLLANGVVQAARYEEDQTLATELPPELREVLA